MTAPPAHRIALAQLAAVAAALTLGACGGGSPKVGDCIDEQRHVVACSSADAAQRLVSDQSKPDAIACVQIGAKPQERVLVGEHPFCAESR